MVCDKAEYLSANVLAINRMNVEAIEKCGGGRHTFFLVIHRSDAAVEEGGCRRFSEIVGHGAKHHDELIRAIQIVDALSRLIDHLQRVYPDISLGMPLRLLLASDEGLELGKQLIDDAELQRKRETN